MKLPLRVAFFMKRIDLTGKRFGRLLVIKETEVRKVWNRKSWECLCDCGNRKNVCTRSLKKGLTQSCGCLQKEKTAEAKIIHGQSGSRISPEFRTWIDIKSRCYNSNVKCFKNYGGRGIRVCDRWLNSFENFYEDMGKRPSDKHSLDRYPNTEGDYELSNCRWATLKEQNQNKRNNKWYEHDNIKMVLEDWARVLNTSPETIKTYSDKEGTTFSEQFEKLLLIGERNRQKGFIWHRK